jgi:hypothetical protein
MIIGIWGLYDKGNLGDDLMSIMIYKFLEEKNYTPIVYNPSNNLIKEFEFRYCTDIDIFVKNVDVIVIGGGGMLINNSFIRFLLKKTELSFELSFFELYKKLSKYKKKVIPISIGGNNKKLSLNNPFKKMIFSPKYTISGTVRLPTDLDVVSKFLFNYYPDIILSISYFFNKKINSAKERLKIVLNIKNKNAKPLIHIFEKYNLFEKFDIYTFSSHSIMDYGKYEYKLDKNHFKFTNIKDALDFLCDSDIIISSKLHVGVIAVSYNIPFISFCGPKKAKEFLLNYGKDDWIIDEPQLIVERLLCYNENFHSKELNYNQKKESYNHFYKLNEILKENL